MFAVFIQVIKRELITAFRRKSDILNPLWFFIIVITLFPLGIGPEPNLLLRIAPGVIWVAALLSALLSMERSLEQLMLTDTPLGLIVTAKVVAHWLLTGLPILFVSPLLAVFLSLDANTFMATFITLLLGTPVLSFVGAIGVALTVGLRKGGVLLSLLILPLFIPVLIFATSAIDAASFGVSYSGPVAILGAMLAASVTLSPFAIAASLRVSLS
ncbi:heme exporter protein CcmB [Moritella viscosa]